MSRRVIHTSAMIVATLAASLGASAVAAAQSPGGGVLVVGDSLEVGTSPYLSQYLPGVSIKVDAVVSRPSSGILRALRENLDGSQAVIVFDAGTNDDPAQPQTLASDLAAAGRLAGSRCMVVATINRPPSNGATVEGLNAVVRAFAASRPGTQVVDWRAAALANPGLIYRDGVHPSSSGYALRGQLVARGIQGCLAPTPPAAESRATQGAGTKKASSHPALSPEERLARARALAARLVTMEVIGHLSRMLGEQGSAGAVLLAAALLQG